MPGVDTYVVLSNSVVSAVPGLHVNALCMMANIAQAYEGEECGLLSENFNSGTAANWTPQEGTWTIESGQYIQSSASPTLDTSSVYSGAGAESWTDYRFECDFQYVSGTNQLNAIQFDFRRSDAGYYSFYFADILGTIEGERIGFSKTVTGGVVTTLADQDYDLDHTQSHHIEIEVSGNTFNVSLDNSQIFTFLDNTFSVGTIALRSVRITGAFDNVCVTSLTAGEGEGSEEGEGTEEGEGEGETGYCPSDSVFSQAPGEVSGEWKSVSSKSGLDRASERFTTTEGLVSEVRWWGTIEDDAGDPAGCQSFIIRFAEAGDVGPGSTVCEYTVQALTTSTTEFIGDLPIYQFDVTLNDPCDITNGWISIQSNETGKTLRWVGSPDGNGIHVYETLGSTVVGAFDLSLCLVTVEGEGETEGETEGEGEGEGEDTYSILDYWWIWVAVLIPVIIIPFIAGGVGGSGGFDPCFIATAAYGTPMAAQIDVLRAFRDTYLLDNALGTAFVDCYYRFSPFLADLVAQHPWLAAAMRVLLTPVILMAHLSLSMPHVAAAVVLAIGAKLMLRWKRRAEK